MVVAHVVDAPPTRFENVPSTSSAVPDAMVKLPALKSEKLPVVVAFAAIVHPPSMLLKFTFANGEFPEFTVNPVVVASKVTVPPEGVVVP